MLLPGRSHRVKHGINAFLLITLYSILSPVLHLNNGVSCFTMTRPQSFSLLQTANSRAMTHHQSRLSLSSPLLDKANDNEDFKGNANDGASCDGNETLQLHPTLSANDKIFGKSRPSGHKSVNHALVGMVLSTILAMSSLTPLQADAAMSGGRMGGSFSPPTSSSSYYRQTPRGGSSYNNYGYSRPSSTIIAPIVVPFTTPYVQTAPIYYGGGVAGVTSYNRGPGLFDLMVVGGMGLFALDAIRNSAAGKSTSWMEAPPTTVVRLSVALNVPNRNDPRSILGVLNHLSRTAKTDSRVGLQDLTSQVAIELLRRKDLFVAAYGTTKQFSGSNNPSDDSDKEAQREFVSTAIRERTKFEREDVSIYSGVDYAAANKQLNDSSGFRTKSTTIQTIPSSGDATLAVVTIILNLRSDSIGDDDFGASRSITSMRDVETFLQKIATCVKASDDCLTAAEILWTPQDSSETLTYKDVVADYPELRMI